MLFGFVREILKFILEIIKDSVIFVVEKLMNWRVGNIQKPFS